MSNGAQQDQRDHGLMDQWRAESALEAVGITSYGPRLIGLTSTVLNALDDAGDDLDAERVEAIVGAHVGPEGLCPACTFDAVAESIQLMFAETPAVRDAESFAEALARTLHLAICSVAFEAFRRLQEMADAALTAQEAAIANREESL
jgi:hypothetical protein